MAVINIALDPADWNELLRNLDSVCRFLSAAEVGRPHSAVTCPVRGYYYSASNILLLSEEVDYSINRSQNLNWPEHGLLEHGAVCAGRGGGGGDRGVAAGAALLLPQLDPALRHQDTR